MYMSYSEKLLTGICEKLQLAPSAYEQATERYQTIARTIQKDDVFASIPLKIYPQGSFRLKTTVKPLNDDEFDLDFVAELPLNASMTPQDLYNHIVRILRNDGIHTNMVELKSRCVRINYANDFHMDIMPGKLIDSQTKEIIVPDRELKKWNHHSNPIAFAEWFENQAKTRLAYELNEARIAHRKIEKVTDQEVTEHLEPLRRAVQLVKRYRDVYCADKNLEPVRSIVICTLMGNISSFSGSTLDIVASFCDYVNKLIDNNPGKPFVVKNPVVDEILTEKWKEGHNYKDFVEMMGALKNDIMALRNMSINSDINKMTQKMFGETVTNLVLTDFAKATNTARNSGNLTVSSTGRLSLDSTGKTVKPNTFYGDDF